MAVGSGRAWNVRLTCHGCSVLGIGHLGPLPRPYCYPGPSKAPCSLVSCAPYLAADSRVQAWFSRLPVLTFPQALHLTHRKGAKSPCSSPAVAALWPQHLSPTPSFTVLCKGKERRGPRLRAACGPTQLYNLA